MSWNVNTGCRYHTQNTNYYCGPTCAMMILAEIGVPYANLDQDDLYTSIHNHNLQAGWASDPYGLRFTLRDRRPAGFTNTFVVHKPTNEAEGTRDIVYTLRVYGVSPAALVYLCQHWLVVCGAQTDVDPNSGPYTIEGLWLNNPIWYDIPPPPPHNAADACGSGGAHGLGNQFVTYATWQADYFTGCDYDDPGGNSQYISVCDPDVRKIELPNRRPKKYLADGRKLISADHAIKFAEDGLKDYGLHRNKISAEVIEAGKPGKPQLVLRLDRPDTYYYLLPWQREEKTMAFVQLDARFGIFNSLQLLTLPMKEWLVSRQSVAKRINGLKLEIEEDGVRFIVRPGTYCVSPTLVWMPCRESFSPHLPFYQIIIGGQQIYARIDGRIFTKLNTTGRGV